MAVNASASQRVLQTIGSLRTGIILLILVGVASAAGTFVLQRPVTERSDIQAAYSPETLRVLDALGLTDVYHSWWYLTLLGLLAVSIVLVSLDRWPNAWRYYARPYRRTDASFRAVLPLQTSIPIGDPEQALAAAEVAFRKQGIKTERITEHNEISLYAEKNRYAVLAVYVVHASLLLIMIGGIFDGIWGYKGYVNLVPGNPASVEVELRDGTKRTLPFALRCDEAGQENYTGQYAMMPKRWWSKLAVVENGREIMRKEIAVNDPLVYRGVRFYQSGYGQSGELKQARVAVVTQATTAQPQVLNLTVGSSATTGDGTTIKLARFIPDAYLMDGEVYQRSKDLNNPAAMVEITAKNGKTQKAWLVLNDDASRRNIVLSGPYDANGAPLAGADFQLLAQMEMLPFTGLQVSHEPGQWAVWAGCVLIGVGLFLAFWVLHQRYWVVPVVKDGKMVLWIGAAANKNREGFAVRFGELTAEVENELGSAGQRCAALQAAAAQS